MILSLLLFAAADFPAFDRAGAERVCAAARAKDPANYDAIYTEPDECVIGQQADYRRFILVAEAATPAMQASFRRCIATWTKVGDTDWGMAEYCAVGGVDGKRDFEMLGRTAAKELRPTLDKCIPDNSEDGVADWQDVGDCARDQTSAYRDFLRARAVAYQPARRDAVDRCRTDAIDSEDKVIDWSGALRCALRIGL